MLNLTSQDLQMSKVRNSSSSQFAIDRKSSTKFTNQRTTAARQPMLSSEKDGSSQRTLTAPPLGEPAKSRRWPAGS